MLFCVSLLTGLDERDSKKLRVPVGIATWKDRFKRTHVVQGTYPAGSTYLTCPHCTGVPSWFSNPDSLRKHIATEHPRTREDYVDRSGNKRSRARKNVPFASSAGASFEWL